MRQFQSSSKVYTALGGKKILAKALLSSAMFLFHFFSERKKAIMKNPTLQEKHFSPDKLQPETCVGDG
jgi:hypothetical protein